MGLTPFEDLGYGLSFSTFSHGTKKGEELVIDGGFQSGGFCDKVAHGYLSPIGLRGLIVCFLGLRPLYHTFSPKGGFL